MRDKVLTPRQTSDTHPCPSFAESSCETFVIRADEVFATLETWLAWVKTCKTRGNINWRRVKISSECFGTKEPAVTLRLFCGALLSRGLGWALSSNYGKRLCQTQPTIHAWQRSWWFGWCSLSSFWRLQFWYWNKQIKSHNSQRRSCVILRYRAWVEKAWGVYSETSPSTTSNEARVAVEGWAQFLVINLSKHMQRYPWVAIDFKFLRKSWTVCYDVKVDMQWCDTKKIFTFSLFTTFSITFIFPDCFSIVIRFWHNT